MLDFMMDGLNDHPNQARYRPPPNTAMIAVSAVGVRPLGWLRRQDRLPMRPRMTVRENQGHLRELYALDVSPDLISRVGVHWNLPSSGEPHMRSSPSSSRTACRLNRRRSTLLGAFAHTLSDTLPKFMPAVVAQPSRSRASDDRARPLPIDPLGDYHRHPHRLVDDPGLDRTLPFRHRQDHLTA